MFLVSNSLFHLLYRRMENPLLNDVCEGLVNEALKKNSKDNIYLILVTVDRIIDTEVISNDNDYREVPDIQ